MKKLKNPVKTVNWICAALMVVLLVLQFMPFWSIDGEGVSLLGYWGFPDDHSNLTSWLDSTLGGFNINEIVFWIIFVAALCVVGAIICLKNSDKIMALLLPAGTGLLGLLFCICEPSFRLGQVWILHLLLFLLLLVLPIAVFAIKAQGKIEE